MTAWGVKVSTWLFLCGAVILCGYTTTQALDYAPIVGSWLLMLGAFFGFCDEAQVYRRHLDTEGEGSLNRLPRYHDYEAPERVGLPHSHQETGPAFGDGGE